MERFRFFFSEAFGSLRRNYFMTIAAVLTVLLSMTVLGIVLVFASYMDGMLRDLKDKVEISVYLLDSATPDSIEALQTEIVSWEEVKDSKFISKDEALEIFKEDTKDHPQLAEALYANVLPASFEISLKDPEQVDIVASRFEGRPEVEEVRYGKETAERIFRVANVARNVMVVFIVSLAVVGVLLIGNTIRLSIFARRREVEIMKLVGATNWFIRWPFVIEGVAVGLLGAALAVLIVSLGSNFVMERIRASLVFMSVQFESIALWQLAGILLLAGAVIGALGSGLGLRRFLKV
ncbi:MAG: ABC transporter permease [Actinobacteria bacterium]|nr:ABC transporter permease [Actinomycetota bacterium]